MSDSYRTAPPAEWPRSLRAAFLLGYRAAGSSPLIPIVFVSISVVSGLLIGTMMDGPSVGTEAHQAPPCSIEATWNPLAYRGNVTLYTPRSFWFDKTVAYLPDIDAALAVAEKIGCKVQP